jgi:hypothetical protein
LRAGVFVSARCRRSRTISSRKEITAILEQRFLDCLATTASVTRAARLTRRHRSTWYRWRADHAAFAAAWTEAVERGTDALEDEAVRRAVEGVLKPVFHQGKRVGTQRIFSDALPLGLSDAEWGAAGAAIAAVFGAIAVFVAERGR